MFLCSKTSLLVTWEGKVSLELSLYIPMPEVAFKAVGKVLGMNWGSEVHFLNSWGWRRKRSAFIETDFSHGHHGMRGNERTATMHPAQKENCTGWRKMSWASREDKRHLLFKMKFPKSNEPQQGSAVQQFAFYLSHVFSKEMLFLQCWLIQHFCHEV